MLARDEHYAEIARPEEAGRRRPTARKSAAAARLQDEAARMRQLAVFSVAIALVALLTCVLAVPLLYAYLQAAHDLLAEELDLCALRLHDLHLALQSVHQWDHLPPAKRDTHAASIGTRRSARLERLHRAAVQPANRPEPRTPARFQSLQVPPPQGLNFVPRYGHTSVGGRNADYVRAPPPPPVQLATQVPPSQAAKVKVKPNRPGPPEAANRFRGPSDQCCSCGVGAAGPPGPPGLDGRNGNDGEPGPDLSAQPLEPITFCYDCPEGPTGPIGPAGPAGLRGKPGLPGPPGPPGGNQRGPVGPAGQKGQPGLAGAPGVPGKPGLLIWFAVQGSPGARGPAGPQGRTGPAGAAGLAGAVGPVGAPGDQGRTGPAGQPGRPGDRGREGSAGPDSSCDHCPVPRTPPGY